MNLKNSIDDIQKNPTFILIVVVVSSTLTVFMSQNFAAVSYVNDQIKAAKEEQADKIQDVKDQLKDIKATLKEINHNITELKIKGSQYER